MSHGFIPVANTASIELIYSFNGVVVENQFHVKKGSPYSASDIVTVRTAVNSWDNSTGFQIRATTCNLTRIRTKALDSAGSPMEDFSLPTPRSGAQSAAPLPGNASFAFKKATGLTGRSYRGRWYLVGLTTGMLGANANLANATAISNFQGWLNGLITGLTSAGSTMVVVSYRTGGAYRAAGVTTPVTGFVAVDLNMDSMRKRLTGRGSP